MAKEYPTFDLSGHTVTCYPYVRSRCGELHWDVTPIEAPTMRLLRPRFTSHSLMVVVVIPAIVMSWLRPISRAEAEKIAEARFQKIPGASRWIGRHRVDASPRGVEAIRGRVGH
jgi:hypothetical protein